MKISYLVATLIFAFGLGSLILGVTNTEDVAFFGVTFHPRIGKGVGILAMIAINLRALARTRQRQQG